jgi:hypothetical protein
MKKLTRSLFTKNFTSTGVDVGAVLKKYNTAKYVGQFPLRDTRGEFTDYHADVFYEPNPNRELGHSNYFAIYIREGSVYITGADHVEKLILSVYTDSEGDLIYSRFQHDFRSFKTEIGSVSIDGSWWVSIAEDVDHFQMMGRTLWDGGSCPMGMAVVVRDGEFYEIENGEKL